MKNNPLICRKLTELSWFELNSHPLSPVKHLYLKNRSDRDTETSLIGQIVDAVSFHLFVKWFPIFKTLISISLQCVENNLAVVNAEYLVDREHKCPRSSIRVTSNRLLTNDDIEFAFNTLETVSNRILT